jgi:hypothetical protein
MACLSAMLFLGVFSPGDTMSYYFDTQESLNNIFTADPVVFTVAASSTSIDLSAGSASIVPIMTPDPDSGPIQYEVQAHMTGGDSAFCDAINLLGTSPFVYDAPLVSLQSGTTTQEGPWALSFSLIPGTDLANTTSCNVDIVYKGWNADSPTGFGYSDTEHLSLTFSYTPPPPPAPTSPEIDTATSDATSSSETSTSTPTVVPDDSTESASSTPETTDDVSTTSTDVSTPAPIPESTSTDPVVTSPASQADNSNATSSPPDPTTSDSTSTTQQ